MTTINGVRCNDELEIILDEPSDQKITLTDKDVTKIAGLFKSINFRNAYSITCPMLLRNIKISLTANHYNKEDLNKLRLSDIVLKKIILDIFHSKITSEYIIDDSGISFSISNNFQGGIIPNSFIKNDKADNEG